MLCSISGIREVVCGDREYIETMFFLLNFAVTPELSYKIKFTILKKIHKSKSNPATYKMDNCN